MKQAQELKGKKAFLIWSPSEGWLIRIPSEDDPEEFIDAKILHHDMSITINEDDAVLREADGEYCVDYSDKTLGH